MIGQIVGNYKIVKKLGEGGMGEVYQGVDLMLEREVAIKALRPELSSQTQLVERFRAEAVILAKLNHPNISTLYSFFRQGDQFFMVLEFVPGEPLDSLIRRRGALPCEEAIPLFCQVLDGIDYAHRMGIIHRDIKPANMMLTSEGRLKVLDFGIARILGTSHMTRTGHLVGTIEYMSPEQIKGQETDSRSDIYSLGVLLYEMLTGRMPFQSTSEFELMRAQVEDQPVLPRQLNPAIPFVVEQALLRAMAKNPAERFQTAGEFCDVLLSAGYAPLAARTNSGPHAAYPLSPARVGDPQIVAPLRAHPASAPRPSIAAEYPKETRLAGEISGGAAFEIGRSVRTPLSVGQIAEVGEETNWMMPPSLHRIKCVSEDYCGRVFYDPDGDISVFEDKLTPTPQYYAWNGTAGDIKRNHHTETYATVDAAIDAAIGLRYTMEESDLSN